MPVIATQNNVVSNHSILKSVLFCLILVAHWDLSLCVFFGVFQVFLTVGQTPERRCQ